MKQYNKPSSICRKCGELCWGRYCKICRGLNTSRKLSRIKGHCWMSSKPAFDGIYAI